MKPRIEFTPCYTVPVMFTFSFCIWTKNLTFLSQLSSNNRISCCKSNLQLCPAKTTLAKTSVFPIIHRATYCHLNQSKMQKALD